VLVKGLDTALADRMRLASSNPSSTLSAAEAEALLDLELSLPTQNLNEPIITKKRTRDELLKELKASRLSGMGLVGEEERELVGELKGREEEAFKAAKKEGRFKPIGAPAPSSKKNKSIKDDGSGKVRRKKKKVVVVQEEMKIEEIQPIATSSTTIIDDEEEDDDIFGGAMEYKGLGSDSDDAHEDADEIKPVVNLVAASTSTKRNYFDDNEEDSLTTAGGAPSSIANIAATAESMRKGKGKGRAGMDDDEEGIFDPDKPMRLQGLSDGRTIDARSLLDYDAAAEKEEKRKEVRFRCLLRFALRTLYHIFSFALVGKVDH
jgi:IK cytokine